jgi:hypothetical protein
MDPIYEAYQQTQYRGPKYDYYVNNRTARIIDASDEIFDGKTSIERISQVWANVAKEFGLKTKEITASDKKKFIADFEEMGMNTTDKEQQFSSVIFKKYMKKWLA